MPRNKRKHPKPATRPKSLAETEQSRDGGANALKGFSYQCLYSCCALFELLTSTQASLRFEGIEDVDSYRASLDESLPIIHIQLKTSKDRQDASFMKDTLKNFLEVYLSSPTRDRLFTLVYDFDVADGNLRKLIGTKLDKPALKYWEQVIESLRSTHSEWSWQDFSISEFLDHLRFEQRTKEQMSQAIYTYLIRDYCIATGNESLFANALYAYCFRQMRDRAQITRADLDREVQHIKDEISRGTVNPAHQWIRAVNFKDIQPSSGIDYFAGKKAEFSDIIAGLPIRRPELERLILQSIQSNTITVIKSSSGQGKTTLALQTAYDLRGTYSVYNLSWCNDTQSLPNTVDFIHSRVKIGEQVLILLDNLDLETKEWNRLAQLLHEQVRINYRILITTREDDWYAYAGDQGNLRGLNLIHLELTEQQAKAIYDQLRDENRVCSSLKNWVCAWEQVKDRQLLIEYVFLLTHGEMLSSRVEYQVKAMGGDPCSPKLELLHKICLADTFGIILSIDRLSEYFSQRSINIAPALRSIESEFSIRVEYGRAVSGLHRVRSEHIVRAIGGVSQRAAVLALVELIDDEQAAKLYVHLPDYISGDREILYQRLAERNAQCSYAYNVQVLQGLYSGSANRYFVQHKSTFDQANEHTGLELFALEIGPYSVYQKFSIEIRALSMMLEIDPENANLQYLRDLAQSTEAFNVSASDYALYAHYLHRQLCGQPLHIIKDGFSELAHFLVVIDVSLCLVNVERMAEVWAAPVLWKLPSIAELMLSWFLSDESAYREFVLRNKHRIMQFIKEQTVSLRLYEDVSDNSIHVEYLLMPDDLSDANQLSVSRLECICNMLPIYSIYHAKGIQAQIEFFHFIDHDSSIKNIPLRTLILGSQKNFNSLWTDTILSNYEFASVSEWLYLWLSIRRRIVEFFDMFTAILQKRIQGKDLSKFVPFQLSELGSGIIRDLDMEHSYPKSRRPFEDFRDADSIKRHPKKFYFSSAKFSLGQAVGLICKQEKESRLCQYNLRKARHELPQMQQTFGTVAAQSYELKAHERMCPEELRALDHLIVIAAYYIAHDRVPHFHNKMAQAWVLARQSDEMNRIEAALRKSPHLHDNLIFPQSILREGNFNTLPLIIQNTNISDQDVLSDVMCAFASLHAFDVDQVILMFCISNTNTLIKNTIWISKRYLEALHKALAEDDLSALREPLIAQPLPRIIDKMYLSSFQQSFVIQEDVVAAWLEDAVRIPLLLWAYDLQRSILNTDSDQCYLSRLQSQTESSIRKSETTLKRTMPPTALAMISDAIHRVTDQGDAFTDDDATKMYTSLAHFGSQW